MTTTDRARTASARVSAASSVRASGVYLVSGSLVGFLLLSRVALERRRPASARG